MLVALLVACCYAPVVTHTYAWADDYGRLAAPGSSFVEDASGGRLVDAVVLYASFAWAGTIRGLSGMRAVGVLGVALLGAAVAAFLERHAVRRRDAVFAATGAMLLPPFQSFVGWSVLWPLGWVCLFSVIGGLPWIHERPPGSRAAGFVLLVIANLMYQPAAFFVWALLGVRLFLSEDARRTGARTTVQLGIATLGAFAASVGTAAVTNRVFEVAWKSRAGVVSSPAELIEKVTWTLTRPVVVAARFFTVSTPTWNEAALTAGPVLLVIGVEAWRRSSGSSLHRVRDMGLMAGAALLAIAPNLAVRENQLEVRVVPGLCAAVWLYFALALVWRIETVSQRLGVGGRQRIPGLVALAQVTVLVLGALSSRGNIQRIMIDPAEQKEHFVVAALSSYQPDSGQTIAIVNDAEAWPRRRRVGMLSLDCDLGLDWVAPSEVRVHAREMRLGSLQVKQFRTRAEVSPDSFLLDLTPLVAAIAGPSR